METDDSRSRKLPLPRVVTRAEWEAQRAQLLAEEKALMRRSDA